MKKRIKKERKHDIQIGFHFWKVGIYLFCREYLKYNSWFIIPGVSIDVVNGYDRYLDVELKFLCFGVGIRFIWLKNWRFKYPFWQLFRRKSKFNNDFNISAMSSCTCSEFPNNH